METIFDHNPTNQELKHLIGDLSKKEYLEELSFAPKGENILFIVLLYEYRKDFDTANKYRNQIPDLYKEWQLGVDNHIIFA